MRLRCRYVRLICLGVCVAGSAWMTVQAQQYRVLSSKDVFIYDPSGAVSSVQVLDQAAGTLTNANSTTRVNPASSWWDVVFPVSVFQITTPPKAIYIFYQVGGKPAAPLQVTLTPQLSITSGSFGIIIRDYWLATNIALKVNDQFIEDVAGPCPGGSVRDWQNVTFHDKTKTRTIHGEIEVHAIPLNEARNNPDALGAIHLCLDYALVWRQNSFTIDSSSSNAILAGITVDSSLLPTGPVQFADSSAFSPQAAPASKDAAVFYANLQVAAGTGVAGAWGIDGKVALVPVPFFRGSWTLLSATANTGNNTANVSGTTYTDTIDWMLPGSWAMSIWKKAPTTLTLTAGPKFETDYKLDKKNFLFSGDSVWTPRAFYQPQSYRSKPKNGVLPKYGDDGYAKFGYELEFHAGVESGGALIATTAQNTKKTVSITVPAYQIERVVPQIHGLFQRSIGNAGHIPNLGLLSFDSVLTSRYLFDAENTVRQSKTGALSIKQVSGWKAINTLTSTWNPPKNNNVGLTVTYKDGFDQPKFSRVNSVLVGVLIEF
jgi:hypothetical protein